MEIHFKKKPNSPFQPHQVGLEAFHGRSETPADAFSFVLLQKLIRFSDHGQNRQNHKSSGPLKVQYTGCNEVRHVTWRRRWTQSMRGCGNIESTEVIFLVLPAPNTTNNMHLKVDE